MNRPARIGHNSGAVDALPIPEDVRPGPGWTDQMLEMADHIGAYATLRLVDAFGGQRIYIPADPARGKVYPGIGSIRDVIGDEAAVMLSEVYRREYLLIPTAKYALAHARRSAIVANVREGRMTAADAVRMLKTSKSYLSHLVNHTDEGRDGEEGDLARTGRKSHPGQLHLFGDEEG